MHLALLKWKYKKKGYFSVIFFFLFFSLSHTMKPRDGRRYFFLFKLGHLFFYAIFYTRIIREGITYLKLKQFVDFSLDFFHIYPETLKIFSRYLIYIFQNGQTTLKYIDPS